MAYKKYILEGGEIVEIENEQHLKSISGCNWFKNAIEVLEEEDNPIKESKTHEEDKPLKPKRLKKSNLK